MIKAVTGFLFVLLTWFSLSAAAQQTDTLKADTNQLNKYRIDPGRNALPEIYRPVQIGQQLIPVNLLDYKISYWRKSTIFGLNFSRHLQVIMRPAGSVQLHLPRILITRPNTTKNRLTLLPKPTYSMAWPKTRGRDRAKPMTVFLSTIR
jgi:hypothetical protein